MVRTKWSLIVSLTPRTKLVKAGKVRAAAEGAFKDFAELGDDDDHQDAHDGSGDDHDGAGIEHGGNNLAFDFLGLFHEFGEALEDDFEDAADFAGLDHVDEEAVEDLGMLGQSLGEGAAAFDGGGQIAQDILEVGVFLLLLQARASRARGAGRLGRGWPVGG